MKIAFFSSSDFCIPIIDSIYQSERSNLSLLEVFWNQYQWLVDNQASFKQILPRDWLNDSLVESLKEIISQSCKFSKLEQIINSKIQLELIVTQPNRLNRTKLIQNSVTSYALVNDIKIYQPEKINQEIEIYQEKIREVEVAILASYGQILNQAVLDAPEFGFLNWHPSKLPLLRGPTPMQTALFQGFESTALSWLEMTKQMDAGEIWLQLEVDLNSEIDINQLANQMGLLGSQTWSLPLMYKIVNQIIDKNKIS